MLKQQEVKDAIAQLGKIVRGASLEYKVYAVADGHMRCASQTMMGAVPIDFDGEFAVNSDAFEKAISALRGDIEVEQGKRTLQFISGKARVSVPQVDKSIVRERPVVKGTPVDLDPAFIDAARDVSSVISEERVLDWQSSLIVRGPNLVAMNKGQIMCAAQYEPFRDVPHALLPPDLVDIIVTRRAPPREFVIEEGGGRCMVEFADDSWVVSQLISGTVPQKVFDLLTQMGECEFPITADQKQAVQQIASLGADTIEIGPTAMEATHQHGDIRIEVDTPVSGVTRWGTRHLSKAMSLATHWDPTNYPVSCKFSSDKLRLLVAAKQA